MGLAVAQKMRHTFRHHLQRVQDVERVETVAQEEDEAVTGSNGSSVLLRQFDHVRVGAGPTDKAFARAFAEGQPELDVRGHDVLFDLA